MSHRIGAIATERGPITRFRSVGPLALVVILGTAACSAIAGDSVDGSMASIQAQARVDGGVEQTAILEDGDVSRSEFVGAVDDYLSCLAKEGLTANYVSENPVDGWRPIIDVLWPGLTDEAGAQREEKCMRTTLRYVTYGYSLGNNDVMEAAMMAEVSSCLRDIGEEVSGRERNVAELNPLGADDQQRAGVVETCVLTAGQGYPGVILVY